jgi:ribonucleoside-diphosphate reductase alpha chain
MKFEPSGITNDTDIRFASSIVDYVFRRLALDHLPDDKREVLGIRSIEERTESARAEAAAKGAEPSESAPPKMIEISDAAMQASKPNDAPLCYSCGSKMQPAGSCYVCSSCGSTSGCS